MVNGWSNSMKNEELRKENHLHCPFCGSVLKEEFSKSVENSYGLVDYVYFYCCDSILKRVWSLSAGDWYSEAFKIAKFEEVETIFNHTHKK